MTFRHRITICFFQAARRSRRRSEANYTTDRNNKKLNTEMKVQTTTVHNSTKKPSTARNDVPNIRRWALRTKNYRSTIWGELFTRKNLSHLREDFSSTRDKLPEPRTISPSPISNSMPFAVRGTQRTKGSAIFTENQPKVGGLNRKAAWIRHHPNKEDVRIDNFVDRPSKLKIGSGVKWWREQRANQREES